MATFFTLESIQHLLRSLIFSLAGSIYKLKYFVRVVE